MRSYSHCADWELTRQLVSAVTHESIATAEVIALIAEVDARRLYAPAGYPSMSEYCIHELHLSEDAAFKRVGAARAARTFPEILDALADGRLNLTAVVLLRPHLTAENAEELIAAATHRTKLEVQQLLAERFPRPDVPTSVTVNPTQAPIPAEPAGSLVPAPAHVGPLVPEPVQEIVRSRVALLSPRSYEVRFTLPESGYSLMMRAFELLGLPVSDVPQLFERALHALVAQEEKRRFAATDHPRPPRGSSDPRRVPANVKRAVRKRDHGRCTFVGDGGHRCGSRRHLEFDHIVPVARGGASTVENLRLRCRVHNALEAERVFGAGFMEQKREEAREDAEARRRAVVAVAEVVPVLQQLGYRAAEARAAAALCEAMTEAPLEDRLKRALSYFLPRVLHRGAQAVAGAT